MACASLLNFGIFLVYGPLHIEQSTYSFLFWALFLGLQIYILAEVWRSVGGNKASIVSSFSCFYASTLWAVVGVVISLVVE